jgi:hypothetical protein
MQSAAVARGHDQAEGDRLLPEVEAYLDFRAFGSLPAAGGTGDQPAWLLDGMRVVHAACMKEDKARADKEARRPKR